MPYKHGVYVQEVATSLSVPINGESGLQVIFGTGAIYNADSIDEILKPQLCYTFDEAKAKIGYDENFKAFTLSESIKASFDIFNIAPIVLVNALDINNSNHVGTVDNETISLSGGVGVIENKYPIKATIDISGYTIGNDFEVKYDEGVCTITALSSSLKELSSVTVSYKYIKMSEGKTAVKSSDIVSAIDKLEEIYPRYGMNAGLLLAPGWSVIADVAIKLQSACENINGVFKAFCLIDIPTDTATKYTDVKTAKETLGANSTNAAAFWPMVMSGDYMLHMSAVMGALMASTDAKNDDTPTNASNKAIGITGLCLSDGTEVILDQEKANLINSFGVCTCVNMNGFRSWGNNTCIYPASTDPKDRWIMTRRFFIWDANSLIISYMQRVDSPANYRLIESIVDSANIRGNSFVNRGVCAAYRVIFNPNENPVTAILDGTIKFHIYMAPYTPAEDIEFLLEFDPYAIESALTGGAN